MGDYQPDDVDEDSLEREERRSEIVDRLIRDLLAIRNSESDRAARLEIDRIIREIEGRFL
jgi:hypothetical protein